MTATTLTPESVDRVLADVKSMVLGTVRATRQSGYSTLQDLVGCIYQQHHDVQQALLDNRDDGQITRALGCLAVHCIIGTATIYANQRRLEQSYEEAPSAPKDPG